MASITDPTLLAKAAAALAAIDGAGLLGDLHDEIGAARREWNPRDMEREYRYRSWLSGERHLARELSRLTGAHEEECVAAMRVALHDDWCAVACREIVAYQDRHVGQQAEPTEPPVQQHTQPRTMRRRIA